MVYRLKQLLIYMVLANPTYMLWNTSYNNRASHLPTICRGTHNTHRHTHTHHKNTHTTSAHLVVLRPVAWLGVVADLVVLKTSSPELG